MCRDATRLETAFDAELWASQLLGMWSPPGFGADADDGEREVGAVFVEELEQIGGDGALSALTAIGNVSGTELGRLALERARRLVAAGATPPAWEHAIRQAQIPRALVVRDEVFDDGITVWLEARHEGEEPRALGVYIDHNLGVMAKDILVADSLEEVERILREAHADEDPVELIFEPMDVREAGARIRAAMDFTDMTLDPPVSDDYVSLRALALLLADEIPLTEIDPLHELDADERDRLFSDFLASPEASGLAPESDEADAAATAIDFCADYVDGRPLRWSPVVVELFMTGWLPSKVVAERAYFEAVPAGLEAWVRYAGRRRGIPAWAIERTVTAIARSRDEMLEHAASGGRRGIAADFFAAARDAGVDLSDESALAGFVAGWNARSELA